MRICVKNLPKKTFEKDLESFFSQKGEVTDVYMLRNGKNEFRRVAFIGYKTNEEAVAAKEYFDNALYMNHKISVNIADEEKKNIFIPSESQERKILYSRTIYVRNITKNFEIEAFRKEFEIFGKVISISISDDTRISEKNGNRIITVNNSENNNDSRKRAIVEYKEGKDALRAFKEMKVCLGMRVWISGHRWKSVTEDKNHYNSLFFDFESITKKACEAGRIKKSDLIDINDPKLGSKISVIESDLINATKTFLEHNGIFIDKIIEKKNKKRLILRNPDIFSVLELIKCEYKISVAPSGCLCLLDFKNEKDAIETLKSLNLKRFKNKIIYCEYAPLCENTVDSNNNFIDNDNHNIKMIKSNILVSDSLKSNQFDNNLSNLSNINKRKSNNMIIENSSDYNSNRDINLSNPSDYNSNRDINLSNLSNINKRKSNNMIIENSSDYNSNRDINSINSENITKKNKYIKDNNDNVINITTTVNNIREENKSSKNMIFTTSEKNINKSYKIVIKNVPFQASVADLRAIFSSFTDIVDIRLPLKNTEQHRGFAFLILSSKESVDKIIEYFGTSTHLFGRRLVLEIAKT